MGRILLKNKNWSIISHFCSVTQRSWVPGVGMTSKHPQLIPENIGDYVISSWWLHQIKSQVYLVGKISEREDVEMNKKKLRPNVLLSLTFAVSVLSSNKSLSIWCVSRVFKYDTLVRNLFHIQGGKKVLDPHHHHELHACICLVLWLSGDTYEGWMTFDEDRHIRAPSPLKSSGVPLHCLKHHSWPWQYSALCSSWQVPLVLTSPTLQV